MREARVRLLRRGHVLFDAGAVPERDLVAWVRIVPCSVRAPTIRITQGPSPAPTNAWVVLGAQWRKSHSRNRRSFPLDDQQALAAQDEEVLLIGLAVVHGAGLARLENVDLEADLRVLLHLELRSLLDEAAVGLKGAARTEDIVPHPRDVADVEHKPAVPLRDESSAVSARRASSAKLAAYPSAERQWR